MTRRLLLTTLLALAAVAPRVAGADPGHQGIVAETMVAGGYRYVRIDVGGVPTWLAGPDTPVKVGDAIAASQGTLIADFESRTLGRHFDRIWFVGRLDVVEAPDGRKNTMVAPIGLPAPAAAPSGALRVVDVYARAASLANQSVVVRGQVARFTPGAQQRNWIHLQDGSGDAAKGTHDLTVTTQDVVAVGDHVEVRGVVGLNRDFGYGYHYAVIVEQATVRRTP